MPILANEGHALTIATKTHRAAGHWTPLDAGQLADIAAVIRDDIAGRYPTSTELVAALTEIGART